jgi:hypothetical protein
LKSCQSVCCCLLLPSLLLLPLLLLLLCLPLAPAGAEEGRLQP